MNFLITGGAGSVGRDLTSSLLEKGHRVRVLDKRAEPFAPLVDKKLELIQGRLEDSRLVQEALRGVDTVIHLAWSFSDDPVVLLESDLNQERRTGPKSNHQHGLEHRSRHWMEEAVSRKACSVASICSSRIQ